MAIGVKFDIRVEGSRELQSLFKQLPTKMARTVLVRALRQGATLVRRAAAASVPVDTGRLRKGYEIKQVGRRGPLAANPLVAVQTKRRNHFGIPPGSKWFYPAILEFGAPKRGLKPQRYLARAADNNSRAVRLKILEALDRGLVRAFS